MTIDSVNFNKFYDFGVKKSQGKNSQPAATSQAPTAATAASTPISNKTDSSYKNNLKTLSLIGAAALLIVAFIKRKAIANLFKKSDKNIISEQKNSTTRKQPEKTPDVNPAVNKPEPIETINTTKSETAVNKQESAKQTQKTATGVRLKPIKHDYSLLDEYYRRLDMYSEYIKPQQGRARTPEEKIQEEKLRKAYRSLRDKAREENISFVRIKQESDFSTDPVKNAQEKREYIAQHVLPYLDVSEASAMDGLDMFAKFGTRCIYPNGRKNYEILTTNLTCRPDEEMTDRLLNKFLDVWEKISEKNVDKYKDNEYLCDVLVSFVRLKKNIEEDTILRGLKLLKKLTNQKEDVERIEYSLIGDYDAQYKDSKKIKEAIEDLKEYVKDCPVYYRMPEDR